MRKRNAREAKRLCHCHSWSSLSWDLNLLPWLSGQHSFHSAVLHPWWMLAKELLMKRTLHFLQRLVQNIFFGIMQCDEIYFVQKHYSLLWIYFYPPFRHQKTERLSCNTTHKVSNVQSTLLVTGQGQTSEGGGMWLEPERWLPIYSEPKSTASLLTASPPPRPARPQINRDLDCQRHS